MHTGVIRPRGVNIGNWQLNEATMKGCQVRDWIVGERDTSFSKILYTPPSYIIATIGCFTTYPIQIRDL